MIIAESNPKIRYQNKNTNYSTSYFLTLECRQISTLFTVCQTHWTLRGHFQTANQQFMLPANLHVFGTIYNTGCIEE
jgi:hypothetical protein